MLAAFLGEPSVLPAEEWFSDEQVLLVYSYFWFSPRLSAPASLYGCVLVLPPLLPRTKSRPLDKVVGDVLSEALKERRKRLAKLLSRKTKALRHGIQLSDSITGDGAAIFRHACWMEQKGMSSRSASAPAMSAAGHGHG